MARLNSLLGAFGVGIVRKRVLDTPYYWQNSWKKIDISKVDGFSRLADEVALKTSTLSYDRLYILWQLARQSQGDIAEIGVFKGGSSWLMARAMELDHYLYAFDTFEGHPEVSEYDAEHKTGTFATSYEQVKNYLAYPNVRVVKGDIRETSKEFETGMFGLVHIDVDVYPAVKHCLEFFSEHLLPKGTIVVDDYGFITCPGAKKAVDEFDTEFKRLHLPTGQILLTK